MNRLSFREQVLNLVFLLLLQLPLIHRITLFDQAFGFFYVGFLLLLPLGISRSYLMLIGFLVGLAVDIFTNTPGLHALSCVFIMFIRNFWLSIVNNDWMDLRNINVGTLKWIGFLLFVFPLVFIHHALLFVIENGGFHLFGSLFNKVLFSSLFSTTIILVLNFLISNSRNRT